MGIFNDLFGGIGRKWYEKKFNEHFSSFENFKIFVKYGEDKEKFKYIDEKDLLSIYNSVNQFIIFDTRRKEGHGHLTGYVSYSYLPPEWYYNYNVNKAMKKIDSLIHQKSLPKIEIALAKERTQKWEQRCCERAARYQEIAELKAQKRTKVKIIQVSKSRNPFQNNAPSIRVEYQIEETNEKFVDYLTESKTPFFEYKSERFQFVTGTDDIKDIFIANFIQFKSRVEGQTILVDIIRRNGKINVDNSLDSIFYKIEQPIFEI